MRFIVPKKLSKAERLRIKKQIGMCMYQAETAITNMTSIISGSTDARRILKLKQALLTLRVEYNRIKIRYEDEAN